MRATATFRTWHASHPFLPNQGGWTKATWRNNFPDWWTKGVLTKAGACVNKGGWVNKSHAGVWTKGKTHFWDRWNHTPSSQKELCEQRLFFLTSEKRVKWGLTPSSPFCGCQRKWAPYEQKRMGEQRPLGYLRKQFRKAKRQMHQVMSHIPPVRVNVNESGDMCEVCEQKKQQMGPSLSLSKK